MFLINIAQITNKIINYTPINLLITLQLTH